MTTPVIAGHVPTPEGRAALRHAAREARLRGLPLLVVNMSKDGHDSTIESDLAELDASGVEVSIAPPDALEPGDRVIKAAQETDAALIVLGIRHRSRVGKFLLGSSVQHILLDANCPVLAVKTT